MPIQTNTLNPTATTTRRRQRNLLNQQPFNPLPGALNLTGVEQGLQTAIGGLQPNLQAEQDARLSQTQREFQQAQERLGRQFALTPGGTTTPGLQGGEQQRAFEQLNLGALNLQDQIRADVAARTGAEQRANIGVLAGLQGQGFTQGINLANVDLQRRQQQQSEAVTGSQLQTDSLNRAIAQSQVTGTYTDPQTGQTYTPQEVQRYRDQLALQQSQVTGQYQGQQTLQGQQAQSQLQTESLQRAIAAGSQTGQFVDPQTGQTYTTEQARQFNEQLNLQKAGLTGEIAGQQTLQGRAQQVNELDAALQRAVAQGNATGTFTDPQTGVSQQTLQAEIARAQTRLEESAQNFNEAAQVAQLTGKFVDPTTKETLDTLAKTDQAFQQEVQRASLTGDLNGITTLAARSLALQQAELTGQVGDQKTIAQKALDLQGQIQKGQLALQQQAQAFGQNITEAELTGMYDRMGNETGAFQASFNAKSGEANYNSRYDFDGNGVIDFADWTEFAKISNNQPVQTLQAQALQEQKALNDFNKKVTESGLTGTFAGNQTVQEAQRRFENSMKESQLFVDAPPITLNMNDYSKAFNSQQGQPNYRQDLDIDKNGVINFTDFIEVVGSGRIEVLSGSVTDPFGSNLTFTYKPEGRTSVIAAQLGLDEKRLTEQTRQFNQTFEQARNEFLTNTTGIVYDEQGNPTNMTTLQQQQYDEAKRQFNEQLGVQVSQFAEQLGFSREQLEANIKMGKDAALNDMLLAGFGALGKSGILGKVYDDVFGKDSQNKEVIKDAVKGGAAAAAGAGGGLAGVLSIAAIPGLVGMAVFGTDQKKVGTEILEKPINQYSSAEIDKMLSDISNGEKYGNGTINFDALKSALQAQKQKVSNTTTQQATVTPSTYQPTQADYPRFQAAYKAQQGQPNYNADFDFDGDGVIEFPDYTEYVQRLTGRPLGA